MFLQPSIHEKFSGTRKRQKDTSVIMMNNISHIYIYIYIYIYVIINLFLKKKNSLCSSFTTQYIYVPAAQYS